MIATLNNGSTEPLIPTRRSDGYVYVTAPANGSGYVWLPDTRGTVYTDVLSNTPTASQPSFKTKDGSNTDNPYPERGYYTVYYFNGAIHCQGNMYSSFLGMEDTIRQYPLNGTTPGGVAGPVFMMPKEFTASTYGMSAVCHGDSPYPNQVELLNSGNERGIIAWGKLGTITIDVTVRFGHNFQNALAGVYIPISNTNMGQTTVYPPVSLPLLKSHEVAFNTSVAYFSMTWNASLSGGATKLYAPVIFIGSAYSAWYQTTCNVDVRYGLTTLD